MRRIKRFPEFSTRIGRWTFSSVPWSNNQSLGDLFRPKRFGYEKINFNTPFQTRRLKIPHLVTLYITHDITLFGFEACPDAHFMTPMQQR